MALTLGSHH
jgi:hypothetical protein